jgi:hypothetical protein
LFKIATVFCLGFPGKRLKDVFSFRKYPPGTEGCAASCGFSGPGLKRPKREPGHSPVSGTDIYKVMSLSCAYHTCLRFVDLTYRNKFYLRERSNYVTDTKHCFSLYGFTITSHGDIGHCLYRCQLYNTCIRNKKHKTLLLLETAVFSLYDFQSVCDVCTLYKPVRYVMFFDYALQP